MSETQQTDSTTPKYRCNGREFEYCMVYDVQTDVGRLEFTKKVGTFQNWFDSADAVHADKDDGYRRFELNDVEFEYDVVAVTDQLRLLFFTVVVHQPE